jgi:hypothetical protein
MFGTKKQQLYTAIVIIAIIIVAVFLLWKNKKEKFEDFKNSSTLALYYSPDCGYCHIFMNGSKPTENGDWKKIKSLLQNKIKTVEVNCKDKECLDIPGYPSIVLIKNQERIFFNDSRTVDNIIKFVNKNL